MHQNRASRPVLLYGGAGREEGDDGEKTVCFGEQAAVPAIGLGTWYMGENAAQRQQEVAALRAGIDHGLTVIDTAEMYAHGGAEVVGGRSAACATG